LNSETPHQKPRIAFITYFDSRHADQAKIELQDMDFGGRKIDIHYSMPKDDGHHQEDKNKGTLFVLVRDATEPLDNVKLKTLFDQWGEIKEVRDCNDKAKFVECYDLRDAEKIVQNRQDVAFAGGRLDITYAHRSGPRMRGENQQRSGLMRSNYGDRQGNKFDNRGAEYNRGPNRNFPQKQQFMGYPPMGPNMQGFNQGVNLLGALLAQNQMLTQSLGLAKPPPMAQNLRRPPPPPQPNPAPLQQLAYLLSLQLQGKPSTQPSGHQGSGSAWRQT